MSPFQAEDGTLFVGDKSSVWMTINPETGEIHNVFSADKLHMPISVDNRNSNIQNMLLIGRSQYTIQMASPPQELRVIKYGRITVSSLHPKPFTKETLQQDPINLVQFVRGSMLVGIASDTGNVLWNTSMPSPVVSAYHVRHSGQVQEMSVHDTLSDACEKQSHCEVDKDADVSAPNLTIESKPSNLDHKIDGALVLSTAKEESSRWVVQSLSDEDGLYIAAGRNHTFIHYETQILLSEFGSHVLDWRIHLPKAPTAGEQSLDPKGNEASLTLYSPSDPFAPYNPMDRTLDQSPATAQGKWTLLDNMLGDISITWSILAASLFCASLVAYCRRRSEHAPTKGQDLIPSPPEPVRSIDNKEALDNPGRVEEEDELNGNVTDSPEPTGKKVKKRKPKKSTSKASGNAITEDDTVELANSLIGKLAVSDKVLGYGSHGTIVFEGEFYGRPVAVKRMLSQYVSLAEKEVRLLLKSEEHNHIVKYYAKEIDTTFVYLALELCRGSIADFIEPSELVEGLNPIQRTPLPFELTKDRSPTSDAYKLLHQLALGLRHLHNIKIVHRDLKPHNILLTMDWRPKISDMGFAKKLEMDQNSSSQSFAGSVGWHSPEGLRRGKLGMPSDVFQFGCIMFYVLTTGDHPFGRRFDRDHNIERGKYSLQQIAHLPEAVDLISQMLQQNMSLRPSADQICCHPLFWSSGTRLSFLLEASDRMEPELSTSRVIVDLESLSTTVLGNDWIRRLDDDFVDNLGRYRKYNPASLRDLLRVVRNKRNHYRDLPPALQSRIGSIPDGFLAYFTTRYPRLFISIYHVIKRHYPNEPQFQKFFHGDL
eukprot:TRINITY_DN1871_c0_g2_i6.p1 TRINITY_DN1871_c0_g2~~TRINITY_DN1871_c0_g2_i6.p1  ORF type:complete len:823 (+),score=134.63 TRINITY_DN1871_c0_g2_i6:137-2605(+)